MKPHLAACLFALAIGCRRASAGAPPAVRSEVVLAAAGGLSFARLEVRSAAGARVNVYGGFDAPSVGGQAPRCGDAPCAKEAVVDAFGLATLRVPLTNDALVGASAERRTLSVEVTREGAQGRATHTITPAPALIPYGYGLSVAGRAGHIEIAGDGSVQARDLPAGAALQVGSLPAARVGADGGARVAMDPSQTLAATPLNRMTRALEDPNGSGLLWTPRLALEGAADGGGLRVTLRYPDGVSLAGDLALRPAQAEAMLAAKARAVEGGGIPAPGPTGRAVLVVWRNPEDSGGGMGLVGRAARLGEVGLVAVLERVAQPVACGRYVGAAGGSAQVGVTETHLDAAVYARDTGALVTRRRFAAPPARCPGSVVRRRGESVTGAVGSTSADETAAAQWLRALAAGTAEATAEPPTRRRRRR